MTLKKHFISTYAQIIISDYTVLAAMIAAHTKPPRYKTTSAEETDIPDLLPVERIDDALNGPYAALITALIHAYAQLTKDRLYYTKANEDLLRSEIEEAHTENSEPARSSTELDQLQKQIDNLATHYDHQLNEFRNHWSYQLIDALKSPLNLTELEQDEIFIEEPMSELNKRFVAFHLKKPHLNNEQAFLAYFTLKAILAIHTARNRQHLSCDERDIKQQLNGLKDFFARLKPAEKQIWQQMDHDFEEVTH